MCTSLIISLGSSTRNRKRESKTFLLNMFKVPDGTVQNCVHVQHLNALSIPVSELEKASYSLKSEIDIGSAFWNMHSNGEDSE